jgi:uncharacterized Zn finger protein
MVIASLHMICGNCGCNSEFHHNVETEEGEICVYITCKNCATIHNLETISKQKCVNYTRLYSYKSSEFGNVDHCSDGFVRKANNHKIVP